MRIVAYNRLVRYWRRYPDAEKPLRRWYKLARKARWQNFADVRDVFRSVDIVEDRLIFNISGNKYRLMVYVDFKRHGLLIRFFGTHAESDRIDVRTY